MSHVVDCVNSMDTVERYRGCNVYAADRGRGKRAPYERHRKLAVALDVIDVLAFALNE